MVNPIHSRNVFVTLKWLVITDNRYKKNLVLPPFIHFAFFFIKKIWSLLFLNDTFTIESAPQSKLSGLFTHIHWYKHNYHSFGKFWHVKTYQFEEPDIFRMKESFNVLVRRSATLISHSVQHVHGICCQCFLMAPSTCQSYCYFCTLCYNVMDCQFLMIHCIW